MLRTKQEMLDFIKQHKIYLVKKHIDGCKGCYIRYLDLDIIVVDPKLHGKEEEKVLKHEISHYLGKTTYKLNETNLRKIQDAEKETEKITKKI